MSEFPLIADPDRCPYADCDADLRGTPIPEASREFYGNSTHFKRELMCEIRGVYDGGLFYACPDCGRPFHRWGPQSHLHRRAEPHMQQMEYTRRLRVVGQDERRDGPVHAAVSLYAGAPLSTVPDRWLNELLQRADLTRPQLEKIVNIL